MDFTSRRSSWFYNGRAQQHEPFNSFLSTVVYECFHRRYHIQDQGRYKIDRSYLLHFRPRYRVRRSVQPIESTTGKFVCRISTGTTCNEERFIPVSQQARKAAQVERGTRSSHAFHAMECCDGVCRPSEDWADTTVLCAPLGMHSYMTLPATSSTQASQGC